MRTSYILLGLLVCLSSVAHATAVTFRYRPTSPAQSVSLAGTFNQWDTGATAMTNHDGLWEVTVDLPEGSHQYKYVVNGNTWVTDEWAAEFADDGFGGENSVVVVGEDPMIAGEGSRARNRGADPLAAPKGTEVQITYRGLANAVSVAGSFNDFDAGANPMARMEDGVWGLTLRLDPGEYRVQIVVDGRRWIDTDFEMSTEADGFGGTRALLRVGTEAMRVGD